MELIQLEGSDTDFPHRLLRRIEVEPLATTSFVSSLPIFMYSVVLKTVILNSQAEHSKICLVSDFVHVLQKSKYEVILSTLLEKSKQCNNEDSKVLLYLNILEGVKRVISIYKYLSNVSGKGTKEIGRIVKDLSVHGFQLNPFKGIDEQVRTSQDFSLASSTTFEIFHQTFSEFLVCKLNKIVHFRAPKRLLMQKALWDLLSMACQVIPSANLKDLSMPIELEQVHNQGDGKNVNDNMPLLKWLFQMPFADEDERMRKYCAEKIGPLLFSNNNKILNACYGHSADDHQIVEALYNDIDELLAKYCGVIQSAFSFTIRSTSHSIYTNNSTWSAENDEETFAKYSRLISSISVISSICQYADDSTAKGKLIIQKGIMRLVRIWATVPDECLDLSTANCNMNEKVCWAAFHELQKLNLFGIFTQKTIDSSESTFMPSLFGELLSQGIIHEKIHGRNDSNDQKHYQIVTKMIQTFLLQRNSVQDSYDSIISTLGYVDKILPSIVTGLVLGHDMETLCACTGYRLHLLTELKKMKRREKSHTNEQILGLQNFKLRRLQVNKSFNSKDLTKQTALLCRTDDDIKILSKLLPALLMERNKGTIVFYLKTVLQSQTSLVELIKAKELKIIEELFWELGGEGIDTETEECYSDPQSWLLANVASPAVQGLKKGAIIIWKVSEAAKAQGAGKESASATEGLNSIDCNVVGATEQSNILESWVQKHFMMLLVKCVTIRWKRGRMETKTRALKCLKILICFLKVSESSQYVTQILTMIDSVMCISCDDVLAKSKLQLIAVQCLSNFVRVLVMHSLHTVGENLCKVIVSVFPLFDEDSNSLKSIKGNEANEDESITFNPWLDHATTCVVKMLEVLTEGENGKNLSPFFAELPFLPSHPKLKHIKETLKRYDLNFENISHITAADCSETTVHINETLTSNSSSSFHKLNILDSKMQGVLRKRLHCLKRLFNHENDNVRKLVLEHSISLISENRALFYNLVKTEDASLQFLTVRSSNDNGKEDENRAYNGKEACSSFLNLSILIYL